MTTDWRLYAMLTKADWRPGDEPTIRNKITIRHGDRDVVIPLPPDAEVLELQQVREEMGDEMDRIVVDWHEKCQEVEAEKAALRNLVQHCWVHSGYQDCGYKHMTTEEKALYDEVKRDPE